MSGRTFGVQSSWDDVFRQLGLDVDKTSLNNAIGIADGMNQQVEEFLNRYVVTATNDDGDVDFDAAGTYTFNGDVIANGNITLGSGGVFRTAASGDRVELQGGAAGSLFFYRTGTTTPGGISVGNVGGYDFVTLKGGERSGFTDGASLSLYGNGDIGFGNGGAAGTTNLSFAVGSIPTISTFTNYHRLYIHATTGIIKRRATAGV